VGTGRMGRALAKSLSQGHEVILGSRDPLRAQHISKQIGLSGWGDYRRVIDDCPLAVLAVPYGELLRIVPLMGDVSGKILLDISNPHEGTQDTFDKSLSMAEQLQCVATSAYVVKGWNHFSASFFESPPIVNGRLAALVCGDSSFAKHVVMRVAQSMNLEAFDIGRLDKSLHLELLAGLMMSMCKRDARLEPASFSGEPGYLSLFAYAKP